jgi:methionine--tRNA ligase beta chain|tara:strand:- start:439 stop:801 length:363 start_codon:yes stop_codon:yes gene_type:complete
MENKEQKSNITFDDFLKLDVRICKVISAERVPKTDKLIKLVVDTGIDEREGVTNLGSEFEPEDFVDLAFPFLLNLEPMKMRGIESKVMIMATSDSEGTHLFSSDAEIGSKVTVLPLVVAE